MKTLTPQAEDRLDPGVVIEEIGRVFPDATVTTEVGQHQMWTALFFKFKKPRTWITSGGLGTMGFGFPAAPRGHSSPTSKSRVVAISGDGSFQMNIQEMATAVQEELPVVVANSEQRISGNGTAVAGVVL